MLLTTPWFGFGLTRSNKSLVVLGYRAQRENLENIGNHTGVGMQAGIHRESKR